MFAARKITAIAFSQSKRLPFVSKQYLSHIKFSKSHEYIKVHGNIGTIGITKHAADALGDVVYVDLPAVGNSYTAGSAFGSVESVKAASDVYSPVSGEVVEVNKELEGNPGTVNESPLENGWFIKIKLSDAGTNEFKKLLNEAEYAKHLEEEKH